MKKLKQKKMYAVSNIAEAIKISYQRTGKNVVEYIFCSNKRSMNFVIKLFIPNIHFKTSQKKMSKIYLSQ